MKPQKPKKNKQKLLSPIQQHYLKKEKEVMIYERKRNPFHKLGYNENHIPN
jgi:hypothetical protein